MASGNKAREESGVVVVSLEMELGCFATQNMFGPHLSLAGVLKRQVCVITYLSEMFLFQSRIVLPLCE